MHDIVLLYIYMNTSLKGNKKSIVLRDPSRLNKVLESHNNTAAASLRDPLSQ